MRRQWRLIAGSVMAIAIGVWALNYWVVKSGSRAVYEDISKLPPNDVGLVLGTGRLLRSGAPNPHFATRIKAAVELYRARQGETSAAERR